MKIFDLIADYVPRHLRLGVCVGVPDFEPMQDVPQIIPVVDDSGSVIYSETVLKSQSAFDVMSKYKASAFKLSALVESGVPLRVVNVNASNSVRIDQLEQICKNLDSADKYVERVLAQQKERESWLQPDNDDLSKDFSEIY